METLAIICPTCGTRLKVRDRSLLGQILPCPKCRAMVLLRSEEDRLAVGPDEAVDTEAITREAIPAEAVGGDPPMAAAAPPVEESDAVPPPPPHRWQNPQTQRARQIALVVLLGGAGIISATAIFLVFVRSSLPPTAPPAPAVAEANGPERNPAEPAEERGDQDENSPAADIAPEGAAAEGGRAAEKATGETPQPEETAGTSQPAETDPGEPAEQVSQPPSEASAADATAQAGSQAGASGAAPRGSEPVADNLAGAEAQEAEEAGEDSGAGLPEQLPPGLEKFVPLTAFGEAAPSLQPAPGPKMPSAEELRRRLSGHEEPSVDVGHPDPADPVDIERALRRSLVGLQMVDQPIQEALGVLGQLSGVPIWLDREALDAAEISLRTPVTLKLVSSKDRSVDLRQALDEVAGQIGCAVVESPPGFLKVAPTAARLERRWPGTLDASDLGAIDSELLQGIRRLLPREAEGQPVRVDGNPLRGELSVEGRPISRWHLALALDALRVARGKEPRLPRDSRHRWIFSGAPPAPERLPEEPVEFALERPLAIGRLMDRLADSAGTTVSIDWPSAWSHGLTPTTEILPWMRGSSIATVAEELLKPYDLVAYRDGDEAWWVGTDEAYQGRSVIAVIDLTRIDIASGAGSPDALLARLAAALAVDPAEVPALVDPESGRLLVRLPRGQAERLEAVLAESPVLTSR